MRKRPFYAFFPTFLLDLPSSSEGSLVRKTRVKLGNVAMWSHVAWRPNAKECVTLKKPGPLTSHASLVFIGR